MPDSAASQSVYTFNTSGQEISRLIYQGGASGGTLQREVDTLWASNRTPQSSTVVHEDGVTAAETDTTFDQYGNLDTLAEYDWGTKTTRGNLLRTTTLTYLSSSSYTSRNILNRVITKTVADSTGIVKYREDSGYDEAALSPCPTGAAQHDDTNYGCSFTTRGLPTSVTTYSVNPATLSGPVTKNFTFDSLGNLRTAQVNCCQQKQWSYSAATQYAYPESVTSGSGTLSLTASATYNTSTGMPASATNANGQVTNLTYDNFGRPLTVKRPDNTQITYTYDDASLATSISTPITSTTSRVQKTTVDTLGRPVGIALMDGSGTIYATSETTYDTLGRVSQTSTPHNRGTPSNTTRQYDALGRPTTITLPDGSATTYSYGTITVTVADPVGKKRKTQVDAVGRVTVTFEPDSSNNLTQQTTYAYNVLDELTTVSQGAQARSYSYDGMGRLTSATTPEAGTVSYQYDSFDNLTQKTDARGVVTSYYFDGLNRLTGVAYSLPQGSQVSAMPNSCTSSTNQQADVCYFYDQGGASGFALGRMTELSDPTGTESYTFDLLGRTTKLQKVINGTIYTTQYAYNLSSELTSITYPSGRVVQQYFDAIGRLSKLADANTTYANNLTYNAAQQTTGFLYGNGVCASFGYSSDRMQLTGLSYFTPTTSGNCQTAPSQTLFGLNYFYKTDSTNCPSGASGNNGQIQCIADNADSGRTVNYTYDLIGRLATAATNGSTGYPKWSLSWTYDRYGNRPTQSVTAGTAPAPSVTIDPTTNHITGVSYGYDASGNMINDGVNTLVYDAENRVTSCTGAAGSGTYTYDGNGFRVEKVSASTTTVYTFSGRKVIAEYVNGAAPSSPTTEYIYAGTSLLAKVQGTTTTYYHQDHLSNRLVTNASGGIVEQLGTLPFGESWYTATGEKWLFTTYERDAESGNDYALARYYLNRLGRFMSADPLGGSVTDPQSLNRYSYVENDPTNAADPSGLWMMSPQAFLGGFVPIQFLGGFPTGAFGSNWNEFDLMMNIPLVVTWWDNNHGDVGWQRVFGSGFLDMTNMLLRGSLQGPIKDAIKKALAALKDPKCQGLFNSNLDPSALLQRLAAGNTPNGYIGASDLGGPDSDGRVTAATTSPSLSATYVAQEGGGYIRQSMFLPGSVTITINSNAGAPFSSGYPESQFGGYGNGAAQAATILHELGHAANSIYGDGSSAILNDQDNPGMSKLNTNMVLNDCFGGPK